MKALKLKKELLVEFLKGLKTFGVVYGPVKKGEKYVYAELTDFSLLELKALRTILPVKKFLLPPRFSILNFDFEEGYEDTLISSPKSLQIIFGLHPCEIHSILILDRLFKERLPDPYYLAARERTVIIGLSCVPDDKCFARSTNTHFVEEGFDLGFNELGDHYLVWVGSSLGDDLVRSRLELFDENITQKDLSQYIAWRKWRDSQYQLNLDLTGMPDIMELSYDSPVWEELGDKCLSCGACSMVCPTCPCFNVVDYIPIGERTGIRERQWDSCMLKDFALVAGGHNFREKRSSRVKLWYTHKLKAFITEFGRPACVGCGRCIDTCPVGINVLEVARRLKGEGVVVK
jgi:sulfhydrogenase subunit beta (sulfur reductase)|uniref:4Fe-4S ferredoxin-type domain-containing protein n=1 Tax=candidate division WOR-3 bacterium TaxID=2052148 RepID=A0A7C3YUT3_UNCW3